MKNVMMVVMVASLLLASSAVAWAADGYADMLINRPATGSPAGGNWLYLNNGTPNFDYSGYMGSNGPDSGDLTIAGNFTGGSSADLARYRPSTGNIWMYSTTGGTVSYSGYWGSGYLDPSAGDALYAGDWLGTGKAGIMNFRPSTGQNWLYTSNGVNGFNYAAYGGTFGLESQDQVIPSNFMGNNFTDLLVTRTGDGIVGSPNQYDQVFLYSNNSTTPGVWGGWGWGGRVLNGDLWAAGDVVTSADLNGDGFADLIWTRTGDGIVGSPNQYDQVYWAKNMGGTGFEYQGRLMNGAIWNAGDNLLFADFGGNVPEPATLALLAAGFAFLRRKK